MQEHQSEKFVNSIVSGQIGDDMFTFKSDSLITTAMTTPSWSSLLPFFTDHDKLDAIKQRRENIEAIITVANEIFTHGLNFQDHKTVQQAKDNALIKEETDQYKKITTKLRDDIKVSFGNLILGDIEGNDIKMININPKDIIKDAMIEHSLFYNLPLIQPRGKLSEVRQKALPKISKIIESANRIEKAFVTLLSNALQIAEAHQDFALKSTVEEYETKLRTSRGNAWKSLTFYTSRIANEYDHLRDDKNKLLRRITELKSKINDLEQDSQQYKDQVQQYKGIESKHSHLEIKNDVNNSALRRSQKEKEQQQEKISALEIQINNLKKALSDADKKRDSANKAMNQIKIEHEEEREELRRTLQAAREERNKAEDMLMNNDIKIEELRVQNGKLHAENDELYAQNNELQDSVNALEREKSRREEAKLMYQEESKPTIKVQMSDKSPKSYQEAEQLRAALHKLQEENILLKMQLEQAQKVAKSFELHSKNLYEGNKNMTMKQTNLENQLEKTEEEKNQLMLQNKDLQDNRCEVVTFKQQGTKTVGSGENQEVVTMQREMTINKHIYQASDLQREQERDNPREALLEVDSNYLFNRIYTAITMHQDYNSQLLLAQNKDGAQQRHLWLLHFAQTAPEIDRRAFETSSLVIEARDGSVCVRVGESKQYRTFDVISGIDPKMQPVTVTDLLSELVRQGVSDKSVLCKRGLKKICDSIAFSADFHAPYSYSSLQKN